MLALKEFLDAVKKANAAGTAERKKQVADGLAKITQAAAAGTADCKKQVEDGLKATNAKVAATNAKVAKFEECAKKGELLGKDGKCVSATTPLVRDDKFCIKGNEGVTRWVAKTENLQVCTTTGWKGVYANFVNTKDKAHKSCKEIQDLQGADG